MSCLLTPRWFVTSNTTAMFKFVYIYSNVIIGRLSGAKPNYTMILQPNGNTSHLINITLMINTQYNEVSITLFSSITYYPNVNKSVLVWHDNWESGTILSYYCMRPRHELSLFLSFPWYNFLFSIRIRENFNSNYMAVSSVSKCHVV